MVADQVGIVFFQVRSLILCEQTALIAIPDALDSVQAAGLLCAGLTVFNAIRLSNIRPGDTLAVAGIGGLG